ncbi:MAG: DUF4388 domain-containing protein, partial [Proteobacteria bacterium]|nr:DUF4388 domain-containing protein [Pseudomonadota bacterium]
MSLFDAGSQEIHCFQGYFTDSVRRLFTWVEGFFRFENDMMPPEDRITVRLDLENLIIEGARQLREFEQLQDEIPSLEMALHFTERPGSNMQKMNLSVEEWRVVSFINPKNTIQQIASAPKMNDMEIRRIVYGLIQAGGGSIIIKSVGIITINSTGVIQANGGSNQTITNGMSSGGGGGSGGRINIQTFYNDIVNNGSITANGGAGTNVAYPGGGGGGGGGRITIKALNNITNNGLIQSYGEKGGNAPTCSPGTGGNGGGGGVLNLQDNDGLIIGTLTVSGGAGGDGCLAQDGVVGSSGTVTKSILPAYPYFSSGTFESATGASPFLGFLGFFSFFAL